MVTAVKGDRESKEAAVYQALDQAFINRISRCFDSMCDSTDFPDQAAARFLYHFKHATDMWNEAKTAIEQEYPK